MSELRDLYQEVILDHHKRPRNFGMLEHPDHLAHGHNPLCGDRLTVCVRVDEAKRTIEDVRFEGSGCAISTASASMMTESVKGKSIPEALALYHRMHHFLTGEGDSGREGPTLGKLEVFAGVHEYPARVKCATLAWHTLDAALEDQGDTVTTE